jgi:hypothetical protein
VHIISCTLHDVCNHYTTEAVALTGSILLPRCNGTHRYILVRLYSAGMKRWRIPGGMHEIPQQTLNESAPKKKYVFSFAAQILVYDCSGIYENGSSLSLSLSPPSLACTHCPKRFANNEWYCIAKHKYSDTHTCVQEYMTHMLFTSASGESICVKTTKKSVLINSAKAVKQTFTEAACMRRDWYCCCCWDSSTRLLW